MDTGLTLKCDLHERLLDPLHLPYQSCFVSTALTSILKWHRVSWIFNIGTDFLTFSRVSFVVKIKEKHFEKQQRATDDSVHRAH